MFPKPFVHLQAAVTAKAEMGCIPESGFINAVTEKSLRDRSHTADVFLEDLKENQSWIFFFFFYVKTIHLCCPLFLHSGMKTDTITDSTS